MKILFTTGWLDDGASAPKKMANFDMNSLKGEWFKVLGTH